MIGEIVLYTVSIPRGPKLELQDRPAIIVYDHGAGIVDLQIFTRGVWDQKILGWGNYKVESSIVKTSVTYSETPRDATWRNKNHV